MATAVLLQMAGHEASVNVVGNGVLALLRHPGRAGPAARRPGPGAGRGRGADPVRLAAAAVRADRDRGRAGRRRSTVRAGPEDRRAARRGQPGPGRLRRPGPARRRPRAPTRTSASAPASTTAWARRWPGSSCRSRWPRCSTACPGWRWPASRSAGPSSSSADCPRSRSLSIRTALVRHPPDADRGGGRNEVPDAGVRGRLGRPDPGGRPGRGRRSRRRTAEPWLAETGPRRLDGDRLRPPAEATTVRVRGRAGGRHRRSLRGDQGTDRRLRRPGLRRPRRGDRARREAPGRRARDARAAPVLGRPGVESGRFRPRPAVDGPCRKGAGMAGSWQMVRRARRPPCRD